MGRWNLSGRLRALLGRRAELADAREPIEPQRWGKIPLPAALAHKVALARSETLDRDLFGRESSKTSAEARRRAWERRWHSASSRSAFDPLLSDYLRLGRGPERFEAHLDWKHAKLTLSESLDPPIFQATPENRLLARSLSEKMFPPGIDPDQREAVLAVFATTVPPEVLALVARNGTVIEIVDGTAPKVYREALGPSAEWIHHFAESLPVSPPAGKFDALIGCILLRAAVGGVQPSAQTRAIHELMHALDLVMGRDGRMFSESPEWQALYRDALLRSGGRFDRKAFPTQRSMADPAEFFAECATIYLGRHVEATGTLPEAGNMEIAMVVDLVTREDLRKGNPDVHDRLTQLFSEEVMVRLTDGTAQTYDEFGSGWIAERQQRPIQSADEWFALAFSQLVRGLTLRRPELVQEALRASRVARHAPDFALHNREVPPSESDALEWEILRSMAWLEVLREQPLGQSVEHRLNRVGEPRAGVGGGR